jgi:glutaredoxin
MHPIYKFSLHRLTGLALVLVATGAMAQQVYRQVDKNGKVTFSDRAPTASTEPASASQGGSTTPANAGLPYELRQVAQRYPVTLYSSDECGPCSTARSLLITRGIPFEERTVKSNEEIEALQRLSSQSSLPLLTIGSQQLKGFSDVEWSQYLDAAGYRNGPARPLVAQQAAPAPRAAAAPAAQPAPPPPASSEPSPSNPAGIKF